MMIDTHLSSHDLLEHIPKSKNIQETTDDIPQVDLNLFKKPKIETSFGDRRIGEVHEHEKKA